MCGGRACVGDGEVGAEKGKPVLWSVGEKKIQSRGADVWLEIGLGLGFFLCFFFKIAFFFCVCVGNSYL
jgi:hypothetical protein